MHRSIFDTFRVPHEADCNLLRYRPAQLGSLARFSCLSDYFFFSAFPDKQNEETTKSSTINIVDLAGSERLSGTNSSSGDRLKEGVSINLSLSCLGNCIHALAEKSNGKNIRGMAFFGLKKIRKLFQIFN